MAKRKPKKQPQFTPEELMQAIEQMEDFHFNPNPQRRLAILAMRQASDGKKQTKQ